MSTTRCTQHAPPSRPYECGAGKRARWARWSPGRLRRLLQPRWGMPPRQSRRAAGAKSDCPLSRQASSALSQRAWVRAAPRDSLCQTRPPHPQRQAEGKEQAWRRRCSCRRPRSVRRRGNAKLRPRPRRAASQPGAGLCRFACVSSQRAGAKQCSRTLATRPPLKRTSRRACHRPAPPRPAPPRARYALTVPATASTLAAATSATIAARSCAWATWRTRRTRWRRRVGGRQGRKTKKRVGNSVRPARVL
jgi:hypothetical protein